MPRIDALQYLLLAVLNIDLQQVDSVKIKLANDRRKSATPYRLRRALEGGIQRETSDDTTGVSA